MNGSHIHIKIYEVILAISLRLSRTVSNSFQQGAFWNMSMAGWRQTRTSIISNLAGWPSRYTKNHDNIGLDGRKESRFNLFWAYFRRHCKHTICAALAIGFFCVQSYQVPKRVQRFLGFVPITVVALYR